jgi:hypothetical protein
VQKDSKLVMPLNQSLSLDPSKHESSPIANRHHRRKTSKTRLPPSCISQTISDEQLRGLNPFLQKKELMDKKRGPNGSESRNTKDRTSS